MTRKRPQRVANAIRREIGTMIQEELKDPRIAFTTITRVEITPDLRYAKVYYTVLGNEKETRSTEVAFNNAKGFIKNAIGDRLKLRLTPEIVFKIDKSQEYTNKIEKLFDRLHKEKETKEDA
ncbi:MAG: 30S ribosome-binding factor RbfA [Candidatus Omnitrophica bacterium]|nr:30S ribosome-binding factor RbfA [Candidatus Omnitrophota bacterium]MBU4488583.1 30S ribosome-binding factor RbfA [Candidatus Omnitrophota bacterium]MCG2704463.1 30S ribosome-binding factor RbfA [Candidatus Omnitrophota bacterium]